MKRSPMRKGQGFNRRPAVKKRRKGIRARSAKQRDRLKRQAVTRAELLAKTKECAVSLAGGPGKCWGRLTYHHILPQSRGHDDTLSNAAAVCQHHNQMLSQDVETMRWGHGVGLLKHGWERREE